MSDNKLIFQYWISFSTQTKCGNFEGKKEGFYTFVDTVRWMPDLSQIFLITWIFLACIRRQALSTISGRRWFLSINFNPEQTPISTSIWKRIRELKLNSNQNRKGKLLLQKAVVKYVFNSNVWYNTWINRYTICLQAMVTNKRWKRLSWQKFDTMK